MAFRYRQFKVYQDSLALHKAIIIIVATFAIIYRHLADQMRRAALSVPLNIAEGSGKNSDKDFNRYLVNALGSINEIMACAEIAMAEDLISKEEFSRIENSILDVGNQIGGSSKKLRQ